VKTYMRDALAEYMGLNWIIKIVVAFVTLMFAGAFCVVLYLYLNMFHIIPPLPGKE
jgi:phage shock protein PspC (stress-responsive transcriptional regulator)